MFLIDAYANMKYLPDKTDLISIKEKAELINEYEGKLHEALGNELVYSKDFKFSNRKTKWSNNR